MVKKFNRTITYRGSGASLLWRVFLFATIFVLVSGLVGPPIISSGFVRQYHFDIYGGTGKTLLFGIVVFGLLVRRRPLVELRDWQRRQLIWFGVALGLLAYTLVAVSHLKGGGLWWPLTTHFGILSCLITALCGCFGLPNIGVLIRSYRRQLLLSIGLALLFYLFLVLVYGFWRELSAVVLHAVRWLLRLVGLTAEVIPPRTLLLDKFGVEVAQYCSGIESIALFSGLYALVGLLDWPLLRHRRYLAVFPAALLLLFACNILRVFGLILAGYYINQDIAFSLFHTYAGMVFFILYSGVFWKLMYKRMLQS